MVPTREPEHLAVPGQAAHVRTAFARDPPLGDQGPGGEAQQRDGAFAAVGDVEMLRIAADVQAVCTGTGCQERWCGKRVPVEHPHPGGLHVGDVPRLAIRGDLDVLWHGVIRGQVDRPDELLLLHVDLDQIAGEFAAGYEVAPVGGKVGVVDAVTGDRHRLVDGHGVRVAEDDLVRGLGHDDGVFAVGCEVQVVGIVHGYGFAELGGGGIERGQRVSQVAIDPEGTQIP